MLFKGHQIKPGDAVEMSEPLLLKVAEVARKLSLGKATVYQMIASGELPRFRKGKAVRVPVHALEEWLDAKIRRPL